MATPRPRAADPSLPRHRYIPALDGLRFMAAILVAGGHYTLLEGSMPLSETVLNLTGVGMTLFFVLSGFVIHYNYSATIWRPGGFQAFAVARFARLYPLFILLFLIDFTYTGLAAHGSCGRAGVPGGQWFGLIYYLTFTQSWVYGVICQNALVYQYGPVAAVSWSISVETFFYLVYVVAAILIARRQWLPRRVIGIAAAAYVLVVVYFLICEYYSSDVDRVGSAAFGAVASTAAGYQDSLLRWLLYFNPPGRLGEFFAGMAAAHLYLARRQHAVRLAPAWTSAATLAAIVTVVVVHLWLYGVIAPHHAWVGRIASPLYGPLIAIMMYLVARYDTPWSRLLSRPVIVRLGEASYSIYLLHEILPSAYKRLGLVTADPRLGWAMWAGSLVLLALLSRWSYLLFERPARARIRALLAPQRTREERSEPQSASRGARPAE